MSEVIEVLFENIKFDESLNFLLDLSVQGRIENIQISVKEAYFLGKESNDIFSAHKFFKQCSDGALYVSIENARVANNQLPKTGIQILKYDNIFDLSVDVNSQQLQGIIPLELLLNWASDVSQNLKAQNYLCGLEPASDKDTRFFTGRDLGPLFYGKKVL